MVDFWAPPDALARCRDAHARAAVPAAGAAAGCDRGGGGALEAHLETLELMATLLQLHIEGEVVSDFIDSLRLVRPLTLEGAIAHARVAGCLITGRPRQIRVLRRAAAAAAPG